MMLMTKVLPTHAPPTEVNGYRVLRTKVIPGGGGYRPGWVILVDRGPEEVGPRYVTAWIGDGDLRWYQGDYIQNLTDATNSFFMRSERFLRRLNRC